jgi:23S rRNA (adenine2503-C2)-methyltransferase
VNLIPLNPALEIPFEAPTAAAVTTFGQILADSHILVSIRRQRGQDILAACGQLAIKRAAPRSAAALPPA